MKLPKEDELQEHVRAELVSELEMASELLKLGVGVFDTLQINSPNTPTYDELGVCLGVLTKACQQYRAVVALVVLGLGDVAKSNCRMLLETSFAAQFLMLDEVKLRRGTKDVPAVPNYPLTTAFRTKLYLANDALNLAKTLRGMAEHGGLHSGDDEAILKQAERHAAEICGLIGCEWTKRLKDSGSYSGVNILELADSLGRKSVYVAFYRPASQGVHGANARQSAGIMVETDGSVTIGFPVKCDGVADAMMTASHAFLDVLQAVSLRFGLGLEQRTKQFRLQVQQMKQG